MDTKELGPYITKHFCILNQPKIMLFQIGRSAKIYPISTVINRDIGSGEVNPILTEGG